MTLADIKDGSANTIVASEILRGASNDIRGNFWIVEAGGGMFMSRFTPNGAIHHILDFIASKYAGVTDGKVNRALLVNNNVDNLPSFGGVSVPKIGSSPPTAGSLCNNQTAGFEPRGNNGV